MSNAQTAATNSNTIIVYRDRIAPRSEAQFLRRQYIGFDRLTPVWVGCKRDDGLHDLGVEPTIIGGTSPLGAWDRFRFKQLGILPRVPDLAALRPRLVHAQFGTGGALALPIAQQLGVPLVVTFHGGDATKDRHYTTGALPSIFQRRMAALKRRAALFLCVSEFIRNQLIERGFPREKLRVIRLGVEVEGLPGQAPEPVQPPYVLFVGRFVEKKGIARLIEAVRLLASQGSPIQLVLIGDGPIAADLKLQAAGVPQVSFMGWRPPGEVRTWMQGALALCVPSVVAKSGDTDGLPTVILEAMAEGLPTIGSRLTGIAEAVDDGETGLLVAPGDSPALAAAIRSLVETPGRRRAMRIAALQVVAERFNAKTQSHLLQDALLEVIRAAGTTEP